MQNLQTAPPLIDITQVLAFKSDGTILIDNLSFEGM